MKANLIKPSENKIYDISDACESVAWSGSALSAGRNAEIAYINAPTDSNIAIPQISTGDFLALEENGKEFFYGQFMGAERSSELGTITHTATDFMKNLLESEGMYNFKSRTPEDIATQVLTDLQIPIGEIAKTGINIKSMICDGTAPYDIVMSAYTQAYRIGGKKYFPMIWNRAFNVYEANWIVTNFELSDDSNITKASISESMDSVKNRISIYDENGKQIGEIKDDASIQTYGVYAAVYKREEGVDPNAAAKTILKVLPSQTIKMEAVGDINCLSCYGVNVRDTSTGLLGRYWIRSDKHTWSAGTHTMELELAFEKIMDEKEITAEEGE